MALRLDSSKKATSSTVEVRIPEAGLQYLLVRMLVRTPFSTAVKLMIPLALMISFWSV